MSGREEEPAACGSYEGLPGPGIRRDGKQVMFTLGRTARSRNSDTAAAAAASRPCSFFARRWTPQLQAMGNPSVFARFNGRGELPDDSGNS